MDETMFPRAGKHRRVTDGATGDLFDTRTPLRGRTYDIALDKHRLLTSLERVLVLLSDMQQHGLDEIRTVGGSSGDRRLRDLRAMGFHIDAVRDPHAPEKSGEWVYCLRVIPEHHTQYLDRLIKTPPMAKGA
jgi:hypothetical protein